MSRYASRQFGVRCSQSFVQRSSLVVALVTRHSSLVANTSAPQPAPPGNVLRHGRHSRLLPDILDLPARQRGERLRLALVPLRQRATVLLRGGTRIAAVPVVAQRVPSLEVLPVTGLLKDEILRKMCAVVAHVKPR